MSEDRNRGGFWRNVATGVGVAAAGALFAYMLSEAIDPPTRTTQSERPRSPPKERRRRREFSSSSLRQHILDQLDSGTYECPICLEIIQDRPVRSCKKCYAIYHMDCFTSHSIQCRERGVQLNCPTCRADMDFSRTYRCFCGKKVNPTSVYGRTPHSCGEICGGDNGSCLVKCHPGPCGDS